MFVERRRRLTEMIVYIRLWIDIHVGYSKKLSIWISNWVILTPDKLSPTLSIQKHESPGTTFPTKYNQSHIYTSGTAKIGTKRARKSPVVFKIAYNVWFSPQKKHNLRLQVLDSSTAAIILLPVSGNQRQTCTVWTYGEIEELAAVKTAAFRHKNQTTIFGFKLSFALRPSP